MTPLEKIPPSQQTSEPLKRKIPTEQREIEARNAIILATQLQRRLTEQKVQKSG